ncbi:MAG TPA: threonine synthase [Candidatus Dormibacteraeota bacterium]
MGAPVAGWTSYLQALECTTCGTAYDADRIHGTCPSCGKVLFARYDLPALQTAVTPNDLRGRPRDMWRYRELLPVRRESNVVTLGEGMTPLLDSDRRVSAGLGFDHGRVRIKDEGKNPTGSFKARGMAAAISRAKELGIKEVALPSAGNAGSAAAAYAASAGIRAHIAVPRDVPPVNLADMRMYGADVLLVDGLIDDAGRILHQMAIERGWFELATLKEPYRQEGKKTLGFELAEQGGWGDDCLPDVIVFPTGGGTGIVGMWKAFEELGTLGWIGAKRPKMVVVQAAGCAPLVRAFEQGAEHAQRWEGAATIAAGLRVPSAIGDYLVLKAIRESGGTALTVSDDDMRAAQVEMAEAIGIDTSPEGAATWAALKALRQREFLTGDEDVVLFATGSGTAG